MIRQLGPATLFCSFSSAETQWVHILRILDQLVDNMTYTDEQIENFNWEDRYCLIQSDPVTCARHFDYQVKGRAFEAYRRACSYINGPSF